MRTRRALIGLRRAGSQTARVREQLASGLFCGKYAYFNGLPNGRTRAGEIAVGMGMELASEPCAHRAAGDPVYHDFRLREREPRQLEMAGAAS